MLNNGSFAKTKEKLEQKKHNSQIAKEKGSSYNEETRINLLVPRQ